MSGDLDALYQEMILEHSKRPRNFGPLEPHSHDAEGYNPLCGDKCRVLLRVEGGVIADVRFQGSGCAISTASASLMTQSVKGKPLEEASRLFAQLREALTAEAPPDPEALGKLAVFAGVRQFPMRVKCATLAWHTLMAALEGKGEAVSTE